MASFFSNNFDYQDVGYIRLHEKSILMPQDNEWQTQINQEISSQLTHYHCIKGQLRYLSPSTLSLSGSRVDNKPVLIWQNSPGLARLLSRYMEQQTDAAGVAITIDLPAAQFNYELLSPAFLKQEAKKLEQQREQEEKDRVQERRRLLESQTVTFGQELATAVAQALQQNSFGYSHRDYRGMGLEYRADTWHYGELWDGGMVATTQQWTSQQEFITWLAQQSDASLAMLQSKDPFYWGNQTITRQRLQEFVEQQSH